MKTAFATLGVSVACLLWLGALVSHGADMVSDRLILTPIC